MNRTLLKRFVLLIFLAALSSCAALRPAPPGAPLPTDPALTVGRLDNGLTYYIRENGRPEGRAELRLVVNAGSVLEDPDQLGLAHFLEHMAFNGTEHFKKQGLIDFLEGIGMRFGPDLNAYTGFDETVYMLQVPADDAEIMEKAFLILEDWAGGMSLAPEEVDAERGVVIEEWRLGRGAGARIRDKHYPALFKGARYAERLPIGKIEVLEGFEHDSLKRFYRDWYRPGLMAVVAVGDFNKDIVESLIEKHFSGFDAPAGKARKRIGAPVPDHAETIVSVATDPEAASSGVSVYFKRGVSPSLTHGDYRRSLAESLYTGMLNSRLHELTKKADAPFTSAHCTSGRLVRTKEAFTLSASVQSGGIRRGLGALMAEAERARRHGFTPSELLRRKRVLLSGIERAWNEREKTESSSLAGEYVRMYLNGEPTPGIEYEYQLIKRYLNGITLDEINPLSEEWMLDVNRVVLASAPEKEDITVPDADELRAVLGEVKKEEIAPYVEDVPDRPLLSKVPKAGSVLKENITAALGLTEWRLSNGIRVFLKPTEFKNDEVIFTSYSPGGSSLVEDDGHVAALTATAVVGESGVGGFDSITLGKKLAGKSVRVSPYISELHEGVTGSAAPKDIETMFQLIYLYFTEPGKDAQAYEAYRNRRRAHLENRALTPETVYSDTITKTLSQDHPRRRPWTVELLGEMDLERSYDIYRDRFKDAGDFTFFFAGNFELTEIRPLIETYLGSLPSTGRKEDWRDVGVRPPKGVIEKTVRKGLEPKSRVRIVFTGPFEWTLANRYDIHSMANVLRIRLREVLREETGGVYAVGVWAPVSKYPLERYSVNISFGCDPERVEELTEAVFTLIEELKTTGATGENVRKVKEMQRRGRETALKRNGFWLSRLSGYVKHGDDPMDILKYPELVDGFSSDAVKEAAKRYFDMDNYVRVVLYPEGG